jgi:hypothetical protein
MIVLQVYVKTYENFFYVNVIKSVDSGSVGLERVKSLYFFRFFFFFFATWGFKIRASHILGGCSYCLSHSTSPFL